MGILIVVLFAILICILVGLLMLIEKLLKESEREKFMDLETGMGNLQLFKHHFKNLSADNKKQYTLAYIVMDISYLRSYYRDCSFEDVLKYATSVLMENTREKEISARITENGFALLSPNEEISKKRLEEIVHKLNKFKNSPEKDILPVFHCAFYKLDTKDQNCENLLFNLRKNCSKIYGTNTEVIFCDTHSMNKVKEAKKFNESIMRGFKNKEFKMYLQCIVDNKTKEITSCEALSRWHTEDGVLGPGCYLEEVEASGLISKHDFYMLELACRQLEKWRDTKYSNLSISCNFTRITLSEDDFIDNFRAVADKYNFDRSKLAIEITEDAIEKNRETATRNVKVCKDLGFKIYLDDLGSGYTTLANLCDYPIDVVKMDRDILLKTFTQKGKDLFYGIIALAHSLNIDVVCEGVETDEHCRFVSDSDCDYIQGWYYSKPMPLEECEQFMDNFKN